MPVDFTLPDHDNMPVRLSDLRGVNGTVVAFMKGTYCPDCLRHLAASYHYAKRLAAHGLSLVWILRDEPTNIMAYTMAAIRPLNYILLPDSTPSAAAHFGFKPGELVYDVPPITAMLGPQNELRVLRWREAPESPLEVDMLIANAAAGRAASA